MLVNRQLQLRKRHVFHFLNERPSFKSVNNACALKRATLTMPNKHTHKFILPILYLFFLCTQFGCNMVDCSKIFMTWLDRNLKERLEQHNIKIELYYRYVDDIDFIVRATLPNGNYGKENENM